MGQFFCSQNMQKNTRICIYAKQVLEHAVEYILVTRKKVISTSRVNSLSLINSYLSVFRKRRLSSGLRTLRRDLSLGAVYTAKYGLQVLRYFTPKIWNMVPADIRNVSNLSDFTIIMRGH